ncbi:MAG: hypothetical protein ACP5OJ_02955 [Methanothermobacter sp.]
MVIVILSEEKVNKYCIYCAEEIDAKADICPKCGWRQPEQDETKQF